MHEREKRGGQTNRQCDVHVVKEVVKVCEAQRAEFAREDDPCAVFFVGKQRLIQALDLADHCVNSVPELLETVGEFSLTDIFVCSSEGVHVRKVGTGGLDLAEQSDNRQNKRCWKWLWAGNNKNELDDQNQDCQRKDNLQISLQAAPQLVPPITLFLFFQPHHVSCQSRQV